MDDYTTERRFGYGKTLTVLYNIDLPAPEDEEDEDNLIESWTPRFKR